jgi:hypothetical protein
MELAPFRLAFALSLFNPRALTTDVNTYRIVPIWNHDNKVGIVNRLRAGRQRNRSSFPGGGKYFSLSEVSTPTGE